MNKNVEQSFNNAYLDSLLYILHHIEHSQRAELLNFIKANIPLYKKEYIYTKPYYIKLLLIKTTPAWFYIFLHKLKCTIHRLKRLIIKNKPKRKTSFR